MNTAQRCEAALQAINRALAERAPVSESELVTVTRYLVELRDQFVAERRAGESAHARELLAQTNAILSLLFGVEYPISGVHWDRLDQVRKALGTLAAAAEPA